VAGTRERIEISPVWRKVFEVACVAKDYAEAVKWYRKAAEQNLAVAQNRLGFCYAKGEGVAKDQVEAVKWYREAWRSHPQMQPCHTDPKLPFNTCCKWSPGSKGFGL
jgi:tetratricopeptide (TPR) repeat protein